MTHKITIERSDNLDAYALSCKECGWEGILSGPLVDRSIALTALIGEHVNQPFELRNPIHVGGAHLEEGDLIFRQAVNGWLVMEIAPDGPKGVPVRHTVHEDAEHHADQGPQPADARALLSALRYHFDHDFQHKHNGGLVAEVKAKGYGAEDEGDTGSGA